VKNLLTQILDSNTRPIESIEAVEVIPEKKYSSEELVDQSTLIQLKRFFKNESIDFVSDYQKEAVECCLARDRDVIVRMPTGSGKSLIYQLPAYIERDQQIYTVILSPLVSLIEDQITNINRRIPNMASKISREHWDLKKKPTPLLYMHYNDFKFGSKHSEYFESLINANKLARVVFDEMQTLLLWSPFTYFRQQLPLIRTKPFQLVFLSGSASPVIIDECIYLFSLDQPRIFYQEAPRPHIKYTVTQIPVNQLMPFANDQEKIIIFVSTKARIKEIQQYQILEGVTKNRISEYHGGMNVTERNENQQKWLGGKKAIMIATTAFSLGIDYPKVRQIYVYGSAYELDNLIQMWGRCARDGLPGYCFYIYANHVSPSSKLERRALSDLEENIQCIRVSLKEIDHGSNCSLMNAQLCSFCEAREKKEGKQKIALGVKRVQLQAFAGLYPPLKRIRNDWTDNSSPLEDNAREISEKKDRIFRIASFIISRFPKDGAITCLICEYRKSSNTYHTTRECPVLSDRCKRCLSLDHLENCTYRITFNDEAHILCGLPFENLDKFVYHLGTECFTNARDRLVPYLMYMYYMEQQMIEKIVDKEFTSASSFFEWLFQMEFSVTHAMELLYELDKNLLQNI
jgi:superfamily II DNA helicase RecQ